MTRLIRDESVRVLASVARLTGDVDLAQDAVQEAALRALQRWPRDGVPRSPTGWLMVAARRYAIDVLRRESGRSAKEAAAMHLLEAADDEPPESVIRDDLLRLIFTCCHPALALEGQVALSLRTLCGLSTAEVARSLLVSEATMVKRLTRAKQKIKLAGIRYRLPAENELPGRINGVVATVYLLFNEGYSATAGDDPLRVALVEQALRLARLLHALMPDEPAVCGVLALMLLHDSRRDTRLSENGDVVLLRHQDRSRWDRGKIHEGVLLVGEGLRRSGAGPDGYVVQASIAACHALAPTYEQTDWDAVVSWYDVLLTVQDSPIVRLNRGVAVGERDGPLAGLREIEELTTLADYALWHATKAELLARLDLRGEAALAWRAALQLEPNAGTQRLIRQRLADLLLDVEGG